MKEKDKGEALALAAANGQTDTVRVLLDAGADVHAGVDAALWLAAFTDTNEPAA
jgi:ankyrin repeat protein